MPKGDDKPGGMGGKRSAPRRDHEEAGEEGEEALAS